jgi:predicted RecB family nuclease
MATFADSERAALLGVRGVGPGVVARLESIGISTLHELAKSDPKLVCERASADTGSSCWRNSPLARQTICNAIAFAQSAPA